MKQWLCPICNAWVDAGWWRHSHTQLVASSTESMIQARMSGALDPLAAAEVKVETYLRTGKEPTQEAPDGC